VVELAKEHCEACAPGTPPLPDPCLAAASRRSYPVVGATEGVRLMAFKTGERVVVESESTERPHREGVIEEVVREEPSPRYRIRWDDGRESIYTPAAGALRAAEPSKSR
jgi:Domain of unknown function (DUF1918)